MDIRSDRIVAVRMLGQTRRFLRNWNRPRPARYTLSPTQERTPGVESTET